MRRSGVRSPSAPPIISSTYGSTRVLPFFIFSAFGVRLTWGVTPYQFFQGVALPFLHRVVGSLKRKS